MATTIDTTDPQVPRRSPLRLIVGALFLAWSVFLAVTGQFPVTLIAAMVGVLCTSSYFVRAGELGVRRGSFLIAGALLFCAFFLGELLVVLRPCTGDASCDGPEVVGVLAVVGLTLTSAGAGVAEALLGFRPSEERERRTRRLTIGAFVAIGVLYLLARLFAV